MEAVVERENMTAALKQVRANKGAPGVDGMTIHMLLPFLRQEWPRIKEELLTGRYAPQPVRGVEIPKPSARVMSPKILVSTSMPVCPSRRMTKGE